MDNVFLAIARAYDTNMHVRSPHVAPRLLVPLVSAAQAVHVSEEPISGQLPLDPVEDMRLVGPEFATSDGRPLSLYERRKLLARDVDKYQYDTTHTWTFHIWLFFGDVAPCELHVLQRFDLARHLDGQPL